MSRGRVAAERARERELLAELDGVYRDVDAAYAGYGCPGSTECCRFAVTGREPYVTSIELTATLRAVSARGGPLSAKKRALPLFPGDREERSCALLGSDNRCSIYAARPLGCRSYWCHRAEVPADPVSKGELAAFVRRIQAIAAKHQPGGDQGRPLSRALARR